MVTPAKSVKDSSEKPKKQPGWLNKADMARSLGISEQAFVKWNVEPVARIGRETFFTAKVVLDNRLAHAQLKQEAKKSTPEEDEEYMAQRTRLTREQADQLEMKNAVTRREQAPVALLEMALATLASKVNAILGSIPSTIKKRVPHLTASEINQIQREIIKAQNAASKVELSWDSLAGDD